MRATIIAALLLSSQPAFAQVMPAGQYSTSISGIGGAPRVLTQCMAEVSAEKAMSPPPQSASGCTRRDIVKAGNNLKFDFVCDGMKMHGTGTIGDATYHSDMTMEAEGMAPMHIVTDVKRVGPCKPGETPVNTP